MLKNLVSPRKQKIHCWSLLIFWISNIYVDKIVAALWVFNLVYHIDIGSIIID